MIARADQSLKYLRLLSEHFPTQQSVFTDTCSFSFH